jgi:membrane protease YdiL (CAAX protease family)
MTQGNTDAAAVSVADRWPVWVGPAGFGIAIVVTVVAGFIVAAVALLAGADSPADTPAVALTGTFLQDLALIGTAVVLGSRWGEVRPSDLGLRSAPLRPAVLTASIALAVFYVVSAVYSALVEPTGEQDIVDTLGTERGTGYLLATAFIVILVSPVAEEIFFRGFFYRSLRNRFHPLAAATIVGLVFGAIHYTDSETLQLIPILIVLGVLFCLVYERTGSLYPSIGMHAVNNSIALGVSTDAAGAVPVAVVFGIAAIAGCVAAPALTGAARERP